MKNCFICSKKLNSLNIPLRNVSRTKDENIACTSCYRKVAIRLNKTNLNDEVSNDVIISLDNHKIIKSNIPKKKWFENKGLLILLLFIIPPVGIYGMFKKDSKLWKKIVYLLFGLLMSVWIFGLILTLLIPTDNYKKGLDYYNGKQYTKAYEYFQRVNSDDDNYNDAITKKTILKPIVNSFMLIKKNEKIKKELLKKKQFKREQEKLKKQKELKKRKEEIEKNPKLEFPIIQQNILKILEQSEEKYEDAPNELKKSLVRTKRGKLIRKNLGNTRKFTDWVGLVSDMQTTTKGNAIFEIEIENTGVTIGTAKDEFLNLLIRGNSLISPKSSLYNTISELEKGDKVLVSGSFIPSDKTDYIFESSLTESGSMRDPEFVAKFTKVVKQ